MRLIFFLIFIAFFSSPSLGGIGDVYFCEEIQNIIFDRESGRKVQMKNLNLK